jgi:hypothetical protein
MPLPEPKPYERLDQYLSRCIPVEMEAGKDRGQELLFVPLTIKRERFIRYTIVISDDEIIINMHNSPSKYWNVYSNSIY